jgi:hypothetical protein
MVEVSPGKSPQGALPFQQINALHFIENGAGTRSGRADLTRRGCNVFRRVNFLLRHGFGQCLRLSVLEDSGWVIRKFETSSHWLP